MSSMPYTKERLFCPGPTSGPLELKMAAVMKSPYHRSKDFYKSFMNCRTKIGQLIHTKSNPLLLCSSGTGAMEAAVTNFTDKGDKVLVLSAGKFGERWIELCKAFECNTEILTCEYGDIPSLEQLEKKLKNENYKAVFLQGTESSTGVSLPLQEFAQTIREHSSALIIVDAISYFLCHELYTDLWQIDVLITSSQKALSLAPGLSIINLSQKAEKSFSKRPRYYFDLKRETAAQATGGSAWTPNINLVVSLEEAVTTIEKYSIKECIRQHQKIAHSVRNSLRAMGLELFAKENFSNALTAFKCPTGIEASQLLELAKKEHKTTFAGGQNKLKGKIIRIAHLGFLDPLEVLSGLAVLEYCLNDLSPSHLLGSGVQSFMKSQQEQSDTKNIQTTLKI